MTMEKIFKVYYYVIGKTYQAGEEPHSIEVSVNSKMPNELLFNEVAEQAIRHIHRLFNQHDSYNIIGVEQKNLKA